MLGCRFLVLSPNRNLLGGSAPPPPGLAILTTCEQVTTVRRKEGRTDRSIMSFESEQFFTREHVPHGGGAKLVAGDDSTTIGREGDRKHHSIMAFEGQHFAATDRIPYLGGLIGRPRGNTLAVRGKSHRIDSRAVTLESEQFLPSHGIP